jgi:glycosyltransferase involved in cell wall biosynthesis
VVQALRILILSQWFQPEPIFKGLPLAEALRAKGHDVEVLTGFPNYPGGRVYPGYRIRPWQREVMKGIEVHRVPLYPSHDRSGPRRVLNYLSFGLSSAVAGQFLIKRPDVIYAFNLVTLGLATRLLKLRFGCPVVFDVQDLWPDSVADSGMLDHSLLLRALDRWSRSVYRSADRSIVLSAGMKNELVRRGVEESRVSVVYNWCNEEHMKPAPRDSALAQQMGLQGSFVAMFAGTMGIMQGLDVLLEAAALLKDKEPDIRLVFVGGGIDSGRLKKIALDRQLSNVIFIENQPPENMSRILALADVALVHLKDSPLLRIAIPSKIQAYMAAGKPIIAAIKGEAESAINDSGAGRVVPPDCPECMAEVIAEISRLPVNVREEMGRSGSEYYRSKMSMEVGIDAIETVFIDCLNEKTRLAAN